MPDSSQIESIPLLRGLCEHQYWTKILRGLCEHQYRTKILTNLLLII